jgi:3-oxoacyl-[acyl-carrier protein] reductase
MNKLKGKVALVTGAGRGIGSGIASRLAADGADVIINYARSADRAEALAEQIIAAGGAASTVGADLSDMAQIDAMFASLASRQVKLDILVNNAGGGSGGMPRLADLKLDEYEYTFALNTRAVFFVTQHAVAIMNDGGRVISLSSSSTTTRQPGLSSYAGSKAAVEAFARIWATELAPRRITVNCVLPGIVNTDLIKDNIPPELALKYGAAVPLGRMGEPEDIADVVAFLASDDARWITGQNLAVTGGA